jgi:hypothetical protein
LPPPGKTTIIGGCPGIGLSIGLGIPGGHIPDKNKIATNKKITFPNFIVCFVD